MNAFTAAGEARESSLARRLKHRHGACRGAEAMNVGRVSSAVEQRSHKAEVVGSSPTLATTWIAQMGRAIGRKPICRGFNSRSNAVKGLISL